MAKSNLKWLVIVGVLAALGVGMYFLGKARAKPKDPLSREVLAQRGAAAYASLHTANAADIQTLRQAVDAATLSGKATRREEFDEVKKAVLEFLSMRIGQPDAEAYSRYRLSHGLTFASLSSLESTWGIAKYAPEVLGKPLDIDAPVEKLFAEYFENNLRSSKPSLPSTINVEARGAEISLGAITRTQPMFPGLGSGVQQTQPEELWYGGEGVSMIPWFTSKEMRTALLEKYHTLRCTSAGFVVGFAGGNRATMILGAFFDPVKRRWIVDRVGYSNYPVGMKFISVDF